MFEDFINNCAMESKVDTSNEQIEADTASVLARIKTSEKSVRISPRKLVIPLVAAAAALVVALPFGIRYFEYNSHITQGTVSPRPSIDGLMQNGTVDGITQSVTDGENTNSADISSMKSFSELLNYQNMAIPSGVFWDEIAAEIVKTVPDFKREDYLMTVNVFAPQDVTGMIKFKYNIGGFIDTNKVILLTFEQGAIEGITTSQAFEAAQSSKVNESDLIEAAKRYDEALKLDTLLGVSSDKVTHTEDKFYFDYETRELTYTHTVWYNEGEYSTNREYSDTIAY